MSLSVMRPRVLLLLPGAFSPAGGLEMHDRLVVMAVGQWCSRVGGQATALVLKDRPDQADPRYIAGSPIVLHGFSGDRVRFATSALKLALTQQPSLVISGHVNFSSLVLGIRACAPLARQWLLVYGIDVWTRLPFAARLSIQFSDAVISISDFTAKEMERCNTLRMPSIKLLPCALDPFYAETALARFPVRPRATGRRALAVARLSKGDEYKGIDQIIRAFAQLASDVPDAFLDIVGDGNDRPRLEELSLRLGLRNRVHFHGRVDTARLAQAYAECRFFVMPSAKEGFGIVFLEAAMFGKPSIAGNHGGSPEVVRDGTEGFLVGYEDLPLLTSRMRTLFLDAELAERLGAAAKARLERCYLYSSFKERCFALLDSAHGIASDAGRM